MGSWGGSPGLAEWHEGTAAGTGLVLEAARSLESRVPEITQESEGQGPWRGVWSRGCSG